MRGEVYKIMRGRERGPDFTGTASPIPEWARLAERHSPLTSGAVLRAPGGRDSKIPARTFFPGKEN